MMAYVLIVTLLFSFTALVVVWQRIFDALGVERSLIGVHRGAQRGLTETSRRFIMGRSIWLMKLDDTTSNLKSLDLGGNDFSVYENYISRRNALLLRLW
jgi:hypothetical protein